MTTTDAVPTHQLYDEHHSIRGLLDAMQSASKLDDLLRLLTDLDGMLNEHFRYEESEDGLRPLVEANAPQRSRELEVLFAEHAEIAAGVQELRASADACLQRRDALIARIRDHEARETDLLGAVMYDDIGGSG